MCIGNRRELVLQESNILRSHIKKNRIPAGYGLHGIVEPSWSDLPRDIVECIIGCLYWIDQIRIKAVCKAWSILNRRILSIDNVPWALKKFTCRLTDDDQIYGDCRLLDPLSQEYIVKEPVKGKEYLFLLHAIPCASAYGWVLFTKYFDFRTTSSYFLYSPFTTEVIKLPYILEPYSFQVATFSLNATSPKCVVFLMRRDNGMGNFHVKLCYPGDHSWKDFEFHDDFDIHSYPSNAVYANGIFYCVLGKCELGAFNLELKEWTMLVSQRLSPEPRFMAPKLITSGADIFLLARITFESCKVFKFNSSEMRWDYEDSLDNHVLFISCSSFSFPVVRETSQLANTIFYCHHRMPHFIKFYDNTSFRRSESLARKCDEATECGIVWVQLPSGGIWRADDLIKATSV